MANRNYPNAQSQRSSTLKICLCLSEREIAQSCQVARSTVGDYLMKAKAAGLNWPDVAALSDIQINRASLSGPTISR